MNLINKILNDTELNISSSLRYLNESIDYIGVVLPLLNTSDYFYFETNNLNLISGNDIQIEINNENFSIGDEILIELDGLYEFTKIKNKISTNIIEVDLVNSYNGQVTIFGKVNNFYLNKGIYNYILEENRKSKEIKNSGKDYSITQGTVSYSENGEGISYDYNSYFSKIDGYEDIDIDSSISTIDLIKV